MIKNEEKFWEILNSYDISKVKIEFMEKDIETETGFQIINGKMINKNWKVKKSDRSNFFVNNTNHLFNLSEPFADFVMGINRSASEYSDIINIKEKKEFFDFKNLIKFQSIYVFIVNALEVYCRETFERISKEIIVKDLQPIKLKRFLKNMNLEKKFEFFKSKKGTLDFLLSEFLDTLSVGERKRISFQQPEVIKRSFLLVGFNVISMINGLWQKIIEHIMRWRHFIIHKNLNRLIEHIQIDEFNLDSEIEELENSILDIVQFVFYIESQRLFNYFDQLEMDMFLNLLPKKNFKAEIKENLIKINREQILRIIHILEEGGYYEISKILNHFLIND